MTVSSPLGNARSRTFALAAVAAALVVWTLKAQVPNVGNGALNSPPGTKIEATLLSPPLPGASFVVSPLGIHIATLSHSGSRSVILLRQCRRAKVRSDHQWYERDCLRPRRFALCLLRATRERRRCIAQQPDLPQRSARRLEQVAKVLLASELSAIWKRQDTTMWEVKYHVVV